MRPDLTTLADRFGSAGYRTVCPTAAALLDRGVGLDRGVSTVEHGTDAETLARATALAGAPEAGLHFLFVNLMLAHSPWTLRAAPFVQKTQAALDAGRAPAELQRFLVQPWEIRLFTGPSTHEIGALRYARGELRLSPAALARIRTAYDSEVWAADQAFGEILAADPWMNEPDAREAARARLLERARAAFPPETPSEPLALPAETLEQLKTLGYVDPERWAGRARPPGPAAASSGPTEDAERTTTPPPTNQGKDKVNGAVMVSSARQASRSTSAARSPGIPASGRRA